MFILNKYTWNSLLNNKKRTIVTLIGVILSCALICGTVILGESVQDMLVKTYARTNGYYHVRFEDIPLSKADNIINSKDIINNAITKNLGYTKLNNPKNSIKPYLYVESYNEQAFETFFVNIVDGRLPQNSKEIVISKQAIDNGGQTYKIGQKLVLNLGVRKGEDGETFSNEYLYRGDEEKLEGLTQKEYEVVGIIEKVGYEPATSPGYTAITKLDITNYNYSESVSVFSLLKKPTKIDNVVNKLMTEAKIKKEHVKYNRDLLRALGITGNDQFKKSLRVILTVLISLIVAASVTLIYNSFSISVSERKKQFGLLKSIGATPKQMRKIVYKEAIIIGVIAIPFGILSGIFGIWVVLKIANYLMSDMFMGLGELSLVVSPYVIISTILFLGITLFISAFTPARKAAKISPIDSIRQSDEVTIKVKKRNIKSKFLAKYFGFEADLASKNIKRNKRRYRTMVLSISVSIILFLVFSTFINASFKSVKSIYTDRDINILINGNDINYNDAKKIESIISKDDNVLNYRSMDQKDVRVVVSKDDFNSKFYKQFEDKLTEDNGMFKLSAGITILKNDDYNNLLDKNNLTVDNDIPNMLYVEETLIQMSQFYTIPMFSIKSGDIITLADSNISKIQVAGVLKKAPFAVMKSTNMPMMIVSENTARKMFNAEIDYNIFVEAKNSEKFSKDFFNKDISKGLSIVDYDTNKRNNQRMLILISILCYGFITVITLIGITNIFNSINTSIKLRRREFAMLKSVGLSQRGFNKMLNYESLFYGLGSLVLSLPVGLLLSSILVSSFGNFVSGSSAFLSALPWKEVAISSVGIIILIIFITKYSVRKMKEDNIIEALRAESL